MTAAGNSPNPHALKSADTSTNGASNPNLSPTGTNKLREETSEVNSSRKESFWSKFLDTTMVVGFLTLLATIVTFAIAQKVQTEDGRQKALNDYTNSMKELIASTQIDRDDAKMTASLQNSRTFLVMRELNGDGDRKGQILRLLHEACLIPTDRGLERCVTLDSSPKDWQLGGKENTRYNKLKEAKVKLSGINLSGVVLEDASIPNMDLTGAFMKGANLENANLGGSNLTRADLTQNKEEGCWDSKSIPIIGFVVKPIVKLVCKSNANLQGTGLRWAVLENADLTNANLTRTNLMGANLRNATLTGVNFAAAIYDDGTILPENLMPEQREQMFKIEADASLRNANLSNHDLRWADLQRANLTNANLTKANLSEANLNQTNLSEANLSGVNLIGANLVGANLTNARLDGANLTGVIYCQTTMPDGSINNQNCP